MWLFAILVLVPIIEIALFIQVGGWIGLWPTLGLVVLTAVAGSLMIRAQGLRTLDELQGSLRTLRDPTRPLAHGAMLLFAGAMLLTPGFFTDAVGLALLVPGVRDLLMAQAGRRMRGRWSGVIVGTASSSPDARDPRRDSDGLRSRGVIIDAEYEMTDEPGRQSPTGDDDGSPDEPRRPTGGNQGRSGWSRH